MHIAHAQGNKWEGLACFIAAEVPECMRLYLQSGAAKVGMRLLRGSRSGHAPDRGAAEVGIKLLRGRRSGHAPAQGVAEIRHAPDRGAAEVGIKLLRGRRSGHAPAQGQQKWACACSGAAEVRHLPAQGQQKWACACSGAAEVGMRLHRGSRCGLAPA
jgi:hypothetical protein